MLRSAIVLPWLVCTSVWGQTVVGTWTDADHTPLFGSALAAVGDVDGDGYDEVIVGDPLGLGGQGTAVVLSGRDGAVLARFLGTTLGTFLGDAVAGLGDVDGDGVPDVAAGAPVDPDPVPGAGRVRVYSGSTGGVLWSVGGAEADTRFGDALDRAPDMDGDGVDELVVGASRDLALSEGSLTVLSGADGALRFRVSGDAKDDLLGTSVAAVGDVDGDGVVDLAAGAPQGLGPGYVRVVSGADGAVLYTVPGDVEGGRFGFSVGAAGDVDLDGVPDLAIGAPGLDVGFDDAGALVVASGEDGGLLRFLPGSETWENLGFSVAGVGDVDGDGVADVAAGSDALLGGRVVILSGAAGSEAFDLDPFALAGNEELLASGVTVAPGGDVNGDGLADVLFGVPTRLIADEPGRALAWTPQTLPWTDLGGALGVSDEAPWLDGVGLLQPGQSFELRVFDARPLASASLVMGTGVDRVPFKGGTLVPTLDFLFAGEQVGADGTLVYHPPAPLLGAVGAEVVFQVWIADSAGPHGFTATNAERALVPVPVDA